MRLFPKAQVLITTTSAIKDGSYGSRIRYLCFFFTDLFDYFPDARIGVDLRFQIFDYRIVRTAKPSPYRFSARNALILPPRSWRHFGDIAVRRE